MAKKRVSAARLIGMLLALSPAIIASVLLWMATPDLETWLKARAGDSARPDAFRFVNDQAMGFCVLLWITSVVGAILIFAGRSRYALGLLVGPILGTGGWSLMENFKDPEWATLFATNAVCMMAATPVTLLWAVEPLLRPRANDAQPDAKFVE